MSATCEFYRLEVGIPFSIGPLHINTVRNNHPGHAYSYRLEDQHSIFVYANDAEYKELDDQRVQTRLDFFKDADALIFDAQYGLRESWESRVDFGHSSAMIGVDFARRAGVKKLLLAHHDPSYSDVQLSEIQATAIEYQAQDPSLPTCEVLIAYEGLTLDLTPAGTVDIQLRPDDEAAVLTPTTIFDERGVSQLTQHLADLAVQEAMTGSVIDLSRIERLTTASLKDLVAFSQEHEEGPVVLAAPSPAVEQVIKLGGYGNYFAIYPSVAEGLKAVQSRKALNLPGHIINGQYPNCGGLGTRAAGSAA